MGIHRKIAGVLMLLVLVLAVAAEQGGWVPSYHIGGTHAYDNNLPSRGGTP